VVTDATKKLREPVAYILLAFAGLVALASLFRLFVGSDFTSSAGVVQGTLTPPGLTALVLLAALAGSVALVTELGERTPNARTVTLAALAITGVNVLLGIITALAGFGETGDAGLKIVGFIYALGGLALYGAVGLFLLKTFQGLPAPVRAPNPGPHGQFAGQGQVQYGQQGQQGGQYGAQYGQQGGQGQYGQYGSGQGQYAQPEHNQGQYGAYGAAAGAGAVGGYAAGQTEGQWPQEQGWTQGEQQPSWPAGTEAAAETGAAAEPAEAQPAEQAWSAESHSSEPTQQWSADASQQQWSGQEAGQQWPQEQQQWGGADSGHQQWPIQEQYGRPSPSRLGPSRVGSKVASPGRPQRLRPPSRLKLLPQKRSRQPTRPG
jgi:hypothetical protein